jgi:adenylosuccinate synthase
MNSFILCGMQSGDEAKGSFCDFLAHEKNIDCVVRYNGGSHASHTVVTPEGVIHKFSQLGSGMFLEDCHTYLASNMVINLDNIWTEMKVFSEKTGISIPELMNRIHIHEDCYVVTPYHKLINKLREFSKGDNRRGTVGTGVSEVKYLLNEPKTFPYDPPLGVQVKDIFELNFNPLVPRMQVLQDYVSTFYKENKEVIWQYVPEEMKESLEKEIKYLLEDKAFIKIADDMAELKRAPRAFNFRKSIYSSYEATLRLNHPSAIFEGSQGLLIDGTYGIKPNTTFLDTTNRFAVSIAHCYGADKITKIGIAKAFNSRHGFGWFDAILLRYAQSINDVDEVYLSSLDKLDDFETIKICNEYCYRWIVDERFKELFDYYISSKGYVIITDIKESGEDLGKYLERCDPIYICYEGWKSDISNVSDKSHLPQKCLEYIHLLEGLIKIPITVVSVGPTRNNKIRM